MSFRILTSVFAALVFAGGLWTASCGGGDSPTAPTPAPPTPPPPPPPAPTVSVVEVSPAMATLEVGKTQRFIATARASDGTVISGVEFAWSSSNTAVVTINNSGLATAVAAGTATIRATGNGVSSAAATITVTMAPVASVAISPSATQELMVGEMVTFTAMARTAGGAVRGDVSISWASSDTSVVTITSAGVATAVGAGMAMVRATADGITSSPVTINVAEPPPPEPVVASVTVSPSEAMIEVGAMQQFAAKALTSDGMEVPEAEITWSSSDEMVATVDSDGLATGVGAGAAMITATADSVSGMATLTVAEPPPPEPVVASVTVSPSEAMIEVGAMQQFAAKALTSDGMEVPEAEITWSSSDEMVATVDSDGLATGVGAGAAMITATADSISGTAALTVAEPPPPEPVVATVTVSPTEAMIEVGATQQFAAMALTSDEMEVPDAEITWSSSDDMVATVDSDGLATGVGAGATMITATADSISGMAALTVAEPPPPEPVVAIVTVSPTEAMIEVGATQQFEAMALTSDGMEVPDAEIMWSSSDEMVARVDLDGLATGVGAGAAMITATADSISGTATLTVAEPPPPEPVVASVTVSPTEAMIEVGATQQFEAMALTSDGMEVPDAEIMWSSSDEMVARVDLDGLATGVGAGAAMITATADSISGMATLTVAEPPPPEPVVATVTVSPASMMIMVGGMFQFTAVAMTADGMVVEDVDFSWMSDDTEVARVDETGLVTAVAAGTAMITAMGNDVTSMPATITVEESPPVVASVEIVDAMPVMLEVGDTHQFMAVARTPEGTMVGGLTFAWSSDDNEVATVDSTGLVNAVGAGMADITATTEETTSEPVTVTVAEPPPIVDRVTVTPSSATIEEGETRRFTATAFESDNTVIPDKTFTWSSSNPSVATVSPSSGPATTVRGVIAGTTTIEATVDGKSDTATLTVTEPPPVVSRVSVSPSSATIEEGDTRRFRATAYTSDNEVIPGKTFTWRSSNTTVATVSPSSGSSTTARGVSAGSTTIRASVDGESDTATLTVTEPPPVVDRVSVSPSTASIEEGETRRFRATAYESDGTEIPGKTFTWSSSNPSVATVSPSSGSSTTARGVNAGSTTIRASVDGKSDTARLTVTEPPPVVDRVSVSPSTASIEEGDTRQFTATAYESDGTEIPGKTFSWTSSNLSVATVSPSSGSSTTARGVNAGSTTIRASVDGKSDTARLTVTEPPPVVDRVTVSPSSASIEEGETRRFTATAYESDNTVIPGKTFTWTSSNTTVATINSSGLAEGKQAGSTTIRASVDGKSDTATLTVTEPPPVVDRVAVTPSSASIEEGETRQFTATAYESDNTVIPGKTFTWTSSNTTVATINSSGLAEGKQAGSTTITASVDGKSDTATLTVTEPAPMLRSRTGTISGRNNYNSGGSVTLSQTSDGKLELKITGLSTPSGAPDVYVALYTSSNINWGSGASLPSGARSFGEVSRQSGTKTWTFTPASGENIDSWSHLILHCRLIDSEVGSASLSN